MPATLDDIMTELLAIRALLESAKPTHYVGPPGNRSPTPNATAPSSGGKFDDEPVPQPAMTWSISNAECHQVHFGKNTGVKLADLKDRSLAFYAAEKPPRLKNDGTPFDKRPADVDLENASRTVWHHRRGTLAQPAAAGQAKAAHAEQSTPPGTNPVSNPPSGDEEVPF
jgi:hypothetical protein